MSQDDIIKGCILLVERSKGITLDEEYVLKKAPRIKVSSHSRLSNIELVTLAKKTIFQLLGRTNVTARDLRKAIVNIIEL